MIALYYEHYFDSHCLYFENVSNGCDCCVVTEALAVSVEVRVRAKDERPPTLDYFQVSTTPLFWPPLA